jgi:hypothetical protein
VQFDNSNSLSPYGREDGGEEWIKKVHALLITRELQNATTLKTASCKSVMVSSLNN